MAKVTIKPGDMLRCFSGKNKFYGKVIFVTPGGWGDPKQYWVEVPDNHDVNKIPDWRPLLHGNAKPQEKMNQYLPKEVKLEKGKWYVRVDNGVAKKADKTEIIEDKIRKEIFEVDGEDFHDVIKKKLKTKAPVDMERSQLNSKQLKKQCLL